MTSWPFRPLAAIALATIAAVLAPLGPASATAPQAQLSVYFLRGEQLAQVKRPGATPTEAMQQLVTGPTRAEMTLGFRTYLPRGTRARSVKVSHGVATVDLKTHFGSVRDAGNRLAGLSQIVRTLTALPGTTAVRLLVYGKPPVAEFPRIAMNRPVTMRILQTPDVPVPKPPEEKLRAPDPAVKALQRSLIALGYLVRGDDDGRLGPATQNAVLAFQKWERLGRTGLLDKQTSARLMSAAHPSPLTRGSAGKRAEILIDRQVALLIEDNRVVRTIAVSSGKPSTPTPPGDYSVYAKIPRWWSIPFREWLPWALPFVGGIAFHEFQDVPAFPASHGCVRQSVAVARWTYEFATVGMPVKVIARS